MSKTSHFQLLPACTFEHAPCRFCRYSDTHAECAFDLDVIRNEALQYHGDFTVLTIIEYPPPSSSRFGASLTGPRHRTLTRHGIELLFDRWHHCRRGRLDFSLRCLHSSRLTTQAQTPPCTNQFRRRSRSQWLPQQI